MTSVRTDSLTRTKLNQWRTCVNNKSALTWLTLASALLLSLCACESGYEGARELTLIHTSKNSWERYYMSFLLSKYSNRNKNNNKNWFDDPLSDCSIFPSNSQLKWETQRPWPWQSFNASANFRRAPFTEAAKYALKCIHKYIHIILKIDIQMQVVSLFALTASRDNIILARQAHICISM